MVHNVIHGKPSGMVVIMDFDDENRIKSVFESKEYKKVYLPIRNEAFHEINIQIAKNF